MTQHPDNMNCDDGTTVFEPFTDKTFCFECYPGVTCFTRCCQDLKLHLTPYDIMRLTEHLSLSSIEFIDRFTFQEIDSHFGYPRLFLLMREKDNKCPFLTSQGCTVYKARPGSCRLYPIGRATRIRPDGHEKMEEQFFVVREDHCQGFLEQKMWTVQDWMNNQEVIAYNDFNDLWMTIITRLPHSQSEQELQKKLKMFYLASYQLDDFLKFVLQSRFFEKFELDGEIVQRIKNNDRLELLKLSMRWLRFSLFSDQTLAIKTR